PPSQIELVMVTVSVTPVGSEHPQPLLLVAWAMTRSTVPFAASACPKEPLSSMSRSTSLEFVPSMRTALFGDTTPEYQTGIGCPGAPVTVTPSLTCRTMLVGDIGVW